MKYLSAGILGFAILGAPHTHAQQAGSFEQLPLLVKAGDTVRVTDSQGKSSTGKIALLSGSSLQLSVDGVVRELSSADVRQIDQRRADSLANGAKIGAVIGTVLGIFGGVAAAQECRGCAVAVLPFYVGVGAAIGTGIDAIFERRQTIYRPNLPGAARIRIAPLMDGERKGVSLSLRF